MSLVFSKKKIKIEQDRLFKTIVKNLKYTETSHAFGDLESVNQEKTICSIKGMQNHYRCNKGDFKSLRKGYEQTMEKEMVKQYDNNKKNWYITLLELGPERKDEIIEGWDYNGNNKQKEEDRATFHNKNFTWFSWICVQARPNAFDLVRTINKSPNQELFFWTMGSRFRKQPIIEWLVGKTFPIERMFFNEDVKNGSHYKDFSMPLLRDNKTVLETLGATADNICFTDDCPRYVKINTCNENRDGVFEVKPFYPKQCKKLRRRVETFSLNQDKYAYRYYTDNALEGIKLRVQKFHNGKQTSQTSVSNQ